MSDDVWERVAAAEAECDQERRDAQVRSVDFGKSVERERIQRGWTVEEASKLAGISPKTWQRIEDGKSVRHMTLAKLEWLFDGVPIAARSTEEIVRSIPQLPMPDLERIRDAVNTALAIRKETT